VLPSGTPLVVRRKHLMNYETIKKSYDRKLWSAAMVRTAVKKGVITPEQFQQITGDAYA
jgi:hypothetical protein